MNYTSQEKQLSLDIFGTSLEKSLNANNRWYKLAQILPWDEIERVYNNTLGNEYSGAGNKPARLIIGALIIKHKMNLSDEETIEIIRENPYMQYFIGLEEFSDKEVFDSSLFVTIRKRLGVDTINAITRLLIKEEKTIEATSKREKEDNGEKSDEDKGEKNDSSKKSEENRSFTDEDGNDHNGSIKVDATCCDAEVKYPTDLDLLNDARRVSERLIDKLCTLAHYNKPRTHRKEARHKYLNVIKRRNKSKKLVRKGVKQQLSYLGRNIQNIIAILTSASTKCYDLLSRKEKQYLGTILKVYHQQKGMFDTGTHQCKNRIVSVFQPHIRPIVRGKSKAKVEFGSKIGASITGGYTFIDHLSWDAYNEAGDMQLHIDKYRKRFGYLPISCYADKIYLNRENRALLTKYHIKIVGKPLGRPSQEMQTKQYKEQAAKDMGKRNEIEATFGTGKRVYKANNIRAKLPDTADTWVAMCYLVKNVMKFLRELLFTPLAAIIYGIFNALLSRLQEKYRTLWQKEIILNFRLNIIQ